MIDERCENERWNVAFATKDDSFHYFLGRLPVLGIIVGSFGPFRSKQIVIFAPQN